MPVGGYANEEIERLKVEMADSAMSDFRKLDERSQRVIEEVFSMDPRPAFSRKEPERVYGALVCGRDVRFVIDEGICRIIEIAMKK